MYTLWILLFPILLVPHLAAAKCYKVPARSNKLVPQDHLQTICTGLQGNYQKKEPRDACITDKATGTEWRFYVERTGGDNVLTYTTCTAAFKQELRKCKDSAGYHDNDGWKYLLQSLDGQCMDSTYINNHGHAKAARSGEHATEPMGNNQQGTPIARVQSSGGSGAASTGNTLNNDDLIYFNTSYVPAPQLDVRDKVYFNTGYVPVDNTSDLARRSVRFTV